VICTKENKGIAAPHDWAGAAFFLYFELEHCFKESLAWKIMVQVYCHILPSLRVKQMVETVGSFAYSFCGVALKQPVK